ncbi:MAG TPA: glycosyltransferase family 4 protein [Steroidobacteraceae bacterium]|nr:glycosyltransferase family 4 protein [Steroidobacteraceae bacterium]
MNAPCKVAYLVPRFPALSETFIASEIGRLRNLGVEPVVMSFERPPAADIDKLASSARDLLPDVAYIGLAEAAWAGLKRPLQTLRALHENRRIQDRLPRKPNSLLRLLRAAAVRSRMQRARIRHLHAHWPYASQVAHLVCAMGGASYSVSIHAHEVAHEGAHFPIIFEALSFAAFCNRGAMNYLLPQLAPQVRDRAHLVYHGVDLNGFARLPLPSQQLPIQVISAGRLTATKGFDRLLRACAAARARGIETRLTILGHGPMEAQLRELARELRFADALRMPGWVTHAEVQQHMQAAHVFALLADTTYHDGLPNVLLEAMASGRPVIVSPLPAAREAVTEGVEGFILNSAADTEGFVDALCRCADEPRLLENMGRAARRRVEAEHDADRQITRVAELLRRYAS